MPKLGVAAAMTSPEFREVAAGTVNSRTGMRCIFGDGVNPFGNSEEKHVENK